VQTGSISFTYVPSVAKYISATVAPANSASIATYECWLNTKGIDYGTHGIFSLSLVNNNYNIDYGLTVLWGSYGGVRRILLPGFIIENVSINTWYHLAICGDSSNFKLYLNGTQVSSLSRQTLRAPAEAFRIGNTADNGQDFNGHIDEVRISNSVRYTTTFTPSTTPFQNDSNTLLLMHCDGTDASTVFFDDNGKIPA
jgi:hypothetical protein